jgi:RNA polymerase subunit RPABC4/transcription elongation factor Spt4
MDSYWSKFRTMLGLGPSLSLAECVRCHALTFPGRGECQKCKAAFPGNCVLRKIAARDVPEERVEGFVSCPGCGRLLSPGAAACPECGAAVTREYAARSVEANVTVAQAYGVAQRIESFNPAAFIVLALAAGIHVFGDRASSTRIPYLLLFFALCLWPVFDIRRWFRWFGSYESGDEEFAAGRRKVKGALRLWLAVLAAQAAGLVASWLLR